MNDEWEYSNPDYSNDFYANQGGNTGADEWSYSNPDYSSLPSGGSQTAATGGGNVSFGQLASLLSGGNNAGLTGLLSAGTGLYDLFSNSPNSARGINAAAAQASDPFMSQRAQYQPMLQNLMTNTTAALQNDPAFQARLKVGLDATARQQAAQGYLGSGNILEALQAKGQTMASDEIQNQFNRLALLSGAQTGSPASAGQILAGRYGQRNNAMANIGGALGMGQQGGQGGGQPGGGSSLGSTLSSLSSLYGLSSKLSGLLGGSGGTSEGGGFLGSLFGGGGGGAATTGASELGAGTGGAFDAWAAGQEGAEAGGAAAGTTGAEASTTGATEGAGAGAGLLAIPALAYMIGTQADANDTARQVEGANRTLSRFQAAGVNPDYSKLYSFSTPWSGLSDANVMAMLASGQSLDQFAPQITLNQDYANQLLASNPALAAQGVDLHDLGGDFQRYAAFGQLSPQRQAAQDQYTQWLRKYMYAPRPGDMTATQGGG